MRRVLNVRDGENNALATVICSATNNSWLYPMWCPKCNK